MAAKSSMFIVISLAAKAATTSSRRKPSRMVTLRRLGRTARPGAWRRSRDGAGSARGRTSPAASVPSRPADDRVMEGDLAADEAVLHEEPADRGVGRALLHDDRDALAAGRTPARRRGPPGRYHSTKSCTMPCSMAPGFCSTHAMTRGAKNTLKPKRWPRRGGRSFRRSRRRAAAARCAAVVGPDPRAAREAPGCARCGAPRTPASWGVGSFGLLEAVRGGASGVEILLQDQPRRRRVQLARPAMRRRPVSASVPPPPRW